MIMQKPPNDKPVVENEESNSVDSLHCNGHFVPGRQDPSVASSECNDDKSNDPCSSDDESHEHDNTEQENQGSIIDCSDPKQFKSTERKKKKKTVKVKIANGQDDKSGIKLKIRRTNNFSNHDENHIIVDNEMEQQRKKHLAKNNKRCKSQESERTKSEETSHNGVSDDNLSNKRSKVESDEDSKTSVGINTVAKGTDIEEGCLGLCQAGTRLSLESVVLMETKTGILIVSVQWRGKTLMGALMESERFQIGTLDKDSIYKKEKLNAMNRRNTRRKSKNIFGKKKRKLTTPPDSGENEGGISDGDNPYVCDKASCHMKFGDFQTLRIHIYQKHRMRSECSRTDSVHSRSSLFNGTCRSPITASAPFLRGTKPSLADLVKPDHPPNGVTRNHLSEERNTFSPAYSDISDANEAPVLENEAELKPSSVPAAQPPINLSLSHNPAHLAASNRIMFSPTAPALQPEVSICPSLAQPPVVRIPPSHHETKLPHIANYRLPIIPDPGIINGFVAHKVQPLNGALSSSTVTHEVQDLSVKGPSYHKLYHKAPNTNSSHQHHKSARHKQPINRQQNHHYNHSGNNGLTTPPNSKHSITTENGILLSSNPLPVPPPINGVPISHNYPYVSFSQSVNSQNSRFNFPINQMSLYHPHKF